MLKCNKCNITFGKEDESDYCSKCGSPLKKNIERVIDFPKIFKNKLNLGNEAFEYLFSSNNLVNFIGAGATGTGIAGIATAGWFASLGTLGQIGLSLGFVSTPIGWIAAAGAGGVIGFFGIKKILKKTDKKKQENLPKYINSPLDILGTIIVSIILPPAIKIAYSDRNFCVEENEVIISYFVKEWGFNKKYIKDQINITFQNIDSISYKEFKDTLTKLCAENDKLDYVFIKNAILSVTREVVEADNKIHSLEQQELELLEQSI